MAQRTEVEETFGQLCDRVIAKLHAKCDHLEDDKDCRTRTRDFEELCGVCQAAHMIKFCKTEVPRLERAAAERDSLARFQINSLGGIG